MSLCILSNFSKYASWKQMPVCILSISMQAKNDCYNSHPTNITVSSMQYKNESQNSHTIYI